MKFILLFVAFFVLIHFVFGLPFLKKGERGGGIQEIGMIFLLCALSELSNQVDQFLLLSVGTSRQFGYLIATTRLIPLSRITKLWTCQIEENDKT